VRKTDLERQVATGERAKRELERLAALPDLAAMPNGTVVAVVLKYHSSPTPYVYVGLKENERWFFTGRQGPTDVSSEDAAAWLAKSGRRVLALEVIAEISVLAVPVVDLGEALAAMLGGLQPAARRPYSGEYPDGVFPSGGSYGD
jgi:hypothetical protein